MSRRLRWLAGQFARPEGAAGRWLIGPWLDRISRPMNELVLEALDPRAGETVLEVGFGGGALLRALLACGVREAIGAEVSEAMVVRARRRFRGEKRLRILSASVEALPLTDASVDKAASVNNLYFWPDPAAGMAELARVMRPGGALAIALEPPEELRKWPGHRYGFRHFAQDEVRDLLNEAGFGKARAAWGSGRKPDRFLCLTAVRDRAEAA